MSLIVHIIEGVRRDWLLRGPSNSSSSQRRCRPRHHHCCCTVSCCGCHRTPASPGCCRRTALSCTVLLPLPLPPVPLPLLVPLHLQTGGTGGGSKLREKGRGVGGTGREGGEGQSGRGGLGHPACSTRHHSCTQPCCSTAPSPSPLSITGPSPQPCCTLLYCPPSSPTHCTCSRSCSRCTASEFPSVLPAATVVPQEESLSAETRRPSGRTLRPLEERRRGGRRGGDSCLRRGLKLEGESVQRGE